MWAKKLVEQTTRLRYRDPFWKEYPLILREAVRLKGDPLTLYTEIRSNPTVDLYQLFLSSGFEDQKFYETIQDLIQRNYLRILSVYFSLEFSEKVKEGFLNLSDEVRKHLQREKESNE